MRILVHGECGDYGSGAWCYYETLKEMGHETRFIHPQEGLERYARFWPYRIARKVINRMPAAALAAHARSLRDRVSSFKPQLIIVLKGLWLSSEVILELKASGAFVVLINHDDFFSRFRSNRSLIQMGAIPHYDWVFPTKEVNVYELGTLTERLEFFPFAYYPRIHHPPQFDKDVAREWQAEAVFVGNCYPERLRQLEYLVRRTKLDLKVYGPNWSSISRRSPLRPYVQGRALGPEEMAKAIFYSKMAFGFLCKENRDDYTQRTFEIPACGGVLLAERTARHLTFYREGEEAEFFDPADYEELVGKVGQLLADEERSSTIRRFGGEAVRRGGHTYEHRLKRVLDRCLGSGSHRASRAPASGTRS